MADAFISSTNPARLTQNNLNGAVLTVTLSGDTFIANAPAKPVLTVTPEVGRAVLTWTAPVNGEITGWEYKQGSNDWVAVPGSVAGTRTYRVESLTNGSAYTFRVQSKIRSVYSPESDPKTATILSPHVPVKPTSLTATAGNLQVTLNWQANTDSRITKWQYQVGTGAWTDIVPSDSETRTYTVTGLTNGTSYSFKVRSVSADRNSPASDSASATPVAYTPARPTNLTATAGNAQVALTWTAASDSQITGWQYRQKAGSGAYGAWTDISGSGTSTRAYTVTGLTNGTSYAFQVRSLAGTSGSPASVERTATPLALQVPAAPVLLTVAFNFGTLQVDLTWRNPNNSSITKYQFSNNDGPWTDFVSGGDSATSTSGNTGLGAGSRFRIRAVNAAGNSPPSNYKSQ